MPFGIMQVSRLDPALPAPDYLHLGLLFPRCRKTSKVQSQGQCSRKGIRTCLAEAFAQKPFESRLAAAGSGELGGAQGSCRPAVNLKRIQN